MHYRVLAFSLFLFSCLALAASCEYDAQPYLDQTLFASCTELGANSSCRVLASVQSSGTIVAMYPENSSLSTADGGAKYSTFPDGSLAFGVPLSVGKYVEGTIYAFNVSCSDGENSSAFSGLFTPVTPQSPLWFNTWLVFLKENVYWFLAIVALVALAGLALFAALRY